MRTRKMWEMTWAEVDHAIKDDMGIMLPVGSVEQHGLHLPLSVDFLIPTELCLEIADQVNMLVAPPITYGTHSRPLSGGGQTFVGTTSIRAITFINQVEDIIREFIRQGFKKIVLFNWHMENSHFLYEAAFTATDRGTNKDVKVLVMETPFSSFDEETMDFLYPDGFPGWGLEHAAMFETSIMMHIAPELVQFDLAKDDGPAENPFYDVIPIDERFVAKSGSLWKASLATKEKGERIWRELLKELVPIVKKEFR
ncbi:creatininase [uncultured Brevibacillus sp.]|uniref:creatininase n=1 Tax=uncultured Brevibacillus sp. TaxID=169970 RepID=UPI00259622C3|nr:creatininase [uncultured Brevibacillus sp.]